MKPSSPIALIFVALALSGGVLTASARPPDEDRRNRDHRERTERTERKERPRKPERAKARLSLDRAIEMAETRYQARVVRAETRKSDNGVTYVLRLLNDAGRVWTVRIDASGGDSE